MDQVANAGFLKVLLIVGLTLSGCIALVAAFFVVRFVMRKMKMHRQGKRQDLQPEIAG